MFALSKTEALQVKKVLKRVPKGTSDYQAAWITNSDGEEGGDDDENEDDDEFDEDIAEGSDSNHSMVIQKPFLVSFVSGKLTFGGAYYGKEVCVSKWVGVDNKNTTKTV